MYATVADLRAEGISSEAASDSRLELLLNEATLTIDALCGQFFEPRPATVVVSGRGRSVLSLPWVPLEVSSVHVGGRPQSLAGIRVEGGPALPGQVAPQLRMAGGGRFPAGVDNVEVVGIWGHTEPDGTSLGRVPLAIRRACMLLVMRTIPQLADGPETRDARHGWRLLEERTRDQSYKLDRAHESADLTGDPEVDRLLTPYLVPLAVGAA